VNLAAGLTPAWQQILVFDEFRIGEVNRARDSRWCASGKVINAGIALHRLGGASRTIALAGGLPRGAIERELADLGVPARIVPSSATTRVCTTILDRSGGNLSMTELVENARPMGPGEYEEFLRAYTEEAADAKAAVLTGSLPAGTPARFYRELLERTAGKAVVDARGEELLLALELEPFLVKPNREELGRTVGRTIGSEGDLIDAAGELHRRGAWWCAISAGKDPLVVTSREGARYRLRPPRVPAANPIGCGDCLAAGIAWGLGEGRDVIDAVRLGMGAAAQNVQDLLPSRLDLPSVEALAREVEVERLG